MANTEKCLIIGSGPAGYTAAIYASRANLEPILYTGPEPGGQLMITTEVENFPGYPEGITGPELMDDLKKQAERFGTRIVYEKIEKVDFNGPIHKAWTDSGVEIHAHTVIISTGASAKWLGLESEQRLQNNGVSACAVCDGFFYRGKPVAVVGGGDTAAEEALYLSKLCPEVHLLVRKDELRASKIMQERLFKTDNINIHWNTETKEIIGDEFVTGVAIINNKTQEENQLKIDGFFVAIGHVPNTAFCKNFITQDSAGYIKTQGDSTQTNIPGVFAAGDAQDNIYRQAITAAGTGCMAALESERYLAEIGIL